MRLFCTKTVAFQRIWGLMGLFHAKVAVLSVDLALDMTVSHKSIYLLPLTTGVVREELAFSVALIMLSMPFLQFALVIYP